MRLSVLTLFLLLWAGSALAQQDTARSVQPGEVYEIRIERLSSSRSSNESTGSSTDRDMFIERVLSVTDAGLELEYDVPRDPDHDDENWQFPARVLVPPNGPRQLLNAAELEVRVDRWLAEAEMTREACGHWIFTWNAFQIECDPMAVLEFVDELDLPGNLRPGAAYIAEGARAEAILRRTASGPSGATFVAEMQVDPEEVRRGLVEQDIVVAEIMGNRLTPDAAVRAHSADRISGTTTTTFETDNAGNAWKRTTVTELQITDAEGVTETRTTTQTVDRHLASTARSER
jgi:hypothetical protein